MGLNAFGPRHHRLPSPACVLVTVTPTLTVRVLTPVLAGLLFPGSKREHALPVSVPCFSWSFRSLRVTDARLSDRGRSKDFSPVDGLVKSGNPKGEQTEG